MKFRALPLFAAAFLACAATASAQYRGGTVEIEGFGGYLFGGSLGHFHDFTDNNCCHDSHLSVDNNAYYGGASATTSTTLGVETEYTQSKTHLEIEITITTTTQRLPDVRIGDLRFHYFMAYMTINFGGTLALRSLLHARERRGDLQHDFPGASATPTSLHRFGRRRDQDLRLDPTSRFRFDTRSYSTLPERSRHLRSELLLEQHVGDERRRERGLS
jgi:hypothetical protein